MQRKPFLYVENSPLYRANWNGLEGRDLVVFPLLYEPQHHQILLTGLQQGHPFLKFKGKAAPAHVRWGREPVIHGCEIDRWHFAHELGQVLAYCATGDFEQPGPKQSPVPNLPGLLVDLEHNFLSQILRDGGLMATLSKKCDQLR